MTENEKVEAGTPCEQGGGEHTPVEIRVKPGARIEWRARICFANAHVRLWLRPRPAGPSQLLVDVTGQADISKLIVEPPAPPALPPGDYELRWRIETPSEKWQTRVEVFSNDPLTMRYRRRRMSGDSQGLNVGSIDLAVTP